VSVNAVRAEYDATVLSVQIGWWRLRRQPIGDAARRYGGRRHGSGDEDLERNFFSEHRIPSRRPTASRDALKGGDCDLQAARGGAIELLKTSGMSLKEAADR